MRPRAGLKSAVKIVLKFEVENSRNCISSSLGSEGDECLLLFNSLSRKCNFNYNFKIITVISDIFPRSRLKFISSYHL
jgi:hypothetical protein